jgi:hypothetical protein
MVGQLISTEGVVWLALIIPFSIVVGLMAYRVWIDTEWLIEN